MNIILYIIVIILIIYFISNNNQNNKTEINDNIDQKLINYKISKNSKKSNKNVVDKFNIKQFDVINNNILIHNKFKKELINYKQQKIYNDDIKCKLIEEKKKSMNSLINENAQTLIIKELSEQNNIILNENKSMKLLLKQEFNNCLTDLHNNNIDKTQITKLIIDLMQTNNEILQKINKIKSNISDNNIDNSVLYKLYNNQIDLYNDQYKLYNTKYKFYKKINLKI
jgi:hypothetical protein